MLCVACLGQTLPIRRSYFDCMRNQGNTPNVEPRGNLSSLASYRPIIARETLYTYLVR